MKWAITIQRKIRLAIALAVLMFCIIIFSLFESYNTARIARSIRSIYDDRLIPAADLYAMSGFIQDRRHLLFDELFATHQKTGIRHSADAIDRKLDSLIAKYQETYLVAAESVYLNRLKQHLHDLHTREKQLERIRQSDMEEAQQFYTDNMLPVYHSLNLDLRKLISVQTEIGKQLLDESVKSSASSELLSKLQIVISIILGILILVLVITNKQVPVRQEKYHLN